MCSRPYSPFVGYWTARTILFLVSLTAVCGNYSGRVVPGRVFQFTFNQTSNDHVFEDHGSSLGGIQLPPNVWATRTTGLQFPVGPGLVTEGNVASFAPYTSLTIEAWILSDPNFVKPYPAISASSPILALGSYPDANVQVTEDIRFHFVTDATQADYACGLKIGTIGGQSKVLNFEDPVRPRHDPIYVTLSYDASQRLTCVLSTGDGPTVTAQRPGAFNTTSKVFLGSGGYWQGTLFSVAMYNRVLTAAEQQQNYDAYIPNSRPYCQDNTVAIQQATASLLLVNSSTVDFENERYANWDTIIRARPTALQPQSISYRLENGAKLYSGTRKLTTADGQPITSNGDLASPELLFTTGIDEWGAGLTSFTYSAFDGLARSAICTTTIDVRFVNQRPVPTARSTEAHVMTEAPIQLSSVDINQGDRKGQGDYNIRAVMTYRITTLPANGMLYHPNAAGDGAGTAITSVPTVLSTDTVYYKSVAGSPISGQKYLFSDSFNFTVSNQVTVVGKEATTVYPYAYKQVMEAATTARVTVNVLGELQAQDVSSIGLSESHLPVQLRGLPASAILRYSITRLPTQGFLSSTPNGMPLMQLPIVLPFNVSVIFYTSQRWLYSVNNQPADTFQYIVTQDPGTPTEASSSPGTVGMILAPVNHDPIIIAPGTVTIPYRAAFPVRVNVSSGDPDDFPLKAVDGFNLLITLQQGGMVTRFSIAPDVIPLLNGHILTGSGTNDFRFEMKGPMPLIQRVLDSLIVKVNAKEPDAITITVTHPVPGSPKKAEFTVYINKDGTPQGNSADDSIHAPSAIPEWARWAIWVGAGVAGAMCIAACIWRFCCGGTCRCCCRERPRSKSNADNFDSIQMSQRRGHKSTSSVSQTFAVSL